MIRFIGDVHGEYSLYLDTVKDVPYSVQIGDFGFNYNCLNKLDPSCHKVIAGNHDNYSEVDGKFIHQSPHFLGDFGVCELDSVSFFFVRGGRSIDFRWRKEGRDWWPHEELTYTEGLQAIDLYQKTKPDFVVSHECPAEVISQISNLTHYDGELLVPGSTAELLQQMFDIHQPKLWIFGHHHKDKSFTVKGTNFLCLGELSYFDYQKEG